MNTTLKRTHTVSMGVEVAEAAHMAELRESEAKVVREAESRPVINGADVDGFTSGNFFATDAATAPCVVCGTPVFVGMRYDEINGQPAHESCATEARS